MLLLVLINGLGASHDRRHSVTSAVKQGGRTYLTVKTHRSDNLYRWTLYYPVLLLTPMVSAGIIAKSCGFPLCAPTS